MRFAFVAALCLLASAPLALAQAPGKKIQCWTDKGGNRMCGDRVPPEYAGNKRDIVKDGRVVETVKAARTPEEIAEEKRKKQEAEDARRRADYDRALLETYRSAKDIQTMRDERIFMLDSRITAAEKNSATTDKSLADLRARAEQQAKDGKPVDEKLAKQIKQFERDQVRNAKQLERNRTERAEIETKFNADLARYYELRGGKPPEKPATAAQAAPAAAPAAPAANPAPAPAAPPKT